MRRESPLWHLQLGLTDFRDPKGSCVYQRSQPLKGWVDAARSDGSFQFLRYHEGGPNSHTSVVGFGGHQYSGLNLASQDYLGLSHDDRVKASALAAITRYGTHSAGSEPMGGGLGIAKELERDIVSFTGFSNVVLFPTGWAAGYGALKALIRPDDYVLIDALAHDCLQHGAAAASKYVAHFAHNDIKSAQKKLARIRAENTDRAVFVVTESLFSMDSDVPEFTDLVCACKRYGAFLVVDAAHDFGAMGADGLGMLSKQSSMGDVDCLIGSFSKTFASTGGFVATRDAGIDYYLRGFSGSYTFSNALAPGQIAAISASLQIVGSPEGRILRERTISNAAFLRRELECRNVSVLGIPSPIVIAFVGPEGLARIAYRECLQHGLILNCIEFPACRRSAARFRLQVNPNHQETDLRRAAAIVADAISHADEWLNRRQSGHVRSEA